MKRLLPTAFHQPFQKFHCRLPLLHIISRNASYSTQDNLNVLYKFFASHAAEIPKFTQLPPVQRRNLWSQTEGWSWKQFYDNYAYHHEREMLLRSGGALGDAAGERNEEISSDPNTAAVIPSQSDVIDSLLLKYLREEEEIRWEHRHASAKTTNPKSPNPTPSTPPALIYGDAHHTKIQSKPTPLRTILHQKKSELLQQTGLSRKQLNDRLKVLRYPVRLRVTPQHKSLIEAFLREKIATNQAPPTLDPPTITTTERANLQTQTGLARRQIYTQIQLIWDRIHGRTRNISPNSKEHVRAFLEKSHFERPNTLQRNELQEATGLGRKQLNALIGRLMSER